MAVTTPFRQILLTGASGGIGVALTEELAASGVTLGLVGRDPERLAQARIAAEAKGATVVCLSVDVRDTEMLAQQILAFDAEHPVDLLVVNAGIAHTLPQRGGFESWEQIKESLDVNLYGALATIHPLLEPMRQRGRGQILLVSSLSAYIGMPISPAYSASKAGLKIYGEALRGVMASDGVGVTVACPGFIRSPMSDRFPGPKPFLLTPERAAQQLRKAAERNRARVSFPFPLSLGVWFLSILPSSWNLYLQRLFRF